MNANRGNENDAVRYESDNDVAVITLDRPDRRNALSIAA
jgi:enoyl-CoA hydratase/carnithine racemase